MTVKLVFAHNLLKLNVKGAMWRTSRQVYGCAVRKVLLQFDVSHVAYSEMGIYRDDLSAIIYYPLSLSLKIVLVYRLPITLLQYILQSPINNLDKRFFMHTESKFKVSELALWK